MAIYALGTVVPTIHPDAYVHPDATVIGDVRIGAESSIWPGAVIRGDEGFVSIGARTSIQDGTVVHTRPTLPTVVGDDCIIGHLVHLESCIIEDHALVGSNAVVLERATVRSGALVGASALVPPGMEVPALAMALGVPAQLRLDAVAPGSIDDAVASYVARGRRFRAELRRLD